MVAFDGHAPDSSSKAVYSDPSSVCPADRLYAQDTALDKAVGGGVTNKALTSNVATLTTAAAHGISVGDSVLVAGVDSTFNGTYVATAGTTGSTLNYAKTHADVTSASATGTVSTHDGKPDAYDATKFESAPGVQALVDAGYPRLS